MLRSTATRSDRRQGTAKRLAYLAVLLVAVAGAYALGRSQSPASLDSRDERSVSLYAQALDLVREDYVDQQAVSAKQQTYGAIEGMLDSLGDDGHTRFLSPDEVEQNRQELSGSYVGIGVTLEDKGGKIVVSSPMRGSPAEEAGVRSGDVIVAVDGENVEGDGIGAVASKVRGPEGTRVWITLRRGEGQREFSLQRMELQVPVVSWAMIPGSETAHVQLSSFTADSAEAVEKAFGEARAAGAEKYVLDLRNNPGGRLDQAEEMAGSFLADGSVIYIREDAESGREEIETSGDPEFPDAPMTVLVNEGTASSAEILAGALRDNDRAEVVGTATYGTGTVLQEYTLSDGSAILLGVAEWLTPSGDFIRKSGIEPEIEARLGEDDEPVVPDDLRNLSREEALSRDAQLQRAFEEVKNPESASSRRGLERPSLR